MFSNLNNILNTSKINKKKYKMNKIENYVVALKKTQEKEKKQLEMLEQCNTIINETDNKIILDNNLFVQDKINHLETNNSIENDPILINNLNIN